MDTFQWLQSELPGARCGVRRGNHVEQRMGDAARLRYVHARG
jgi:hypothetical protein